jgi:DNA ligase (NAD+)
MTIVISGNFSISRDDMKALIVANGGKSSGSISGKTTYLLAGEKAGPEKLKKAESLGVKVISEAEFREKLLRSDQEEVTSLRGAEATWQSDEFTGTLF